MPVFQPAIYHEDKTGKRPMTVNDAVFLLDLQKELNTQDSMCNADPRFWVIAQPREWPTDPDRADYFTLSDPDGEIVARNLRELAGYINDGSLPGAKSATWFGPVNDPSSITITLDGGEKISDSSIAGIGQALLDHDITHLSVVPMLLEKNHIIPDTLFLTHRACEDHLREYAYQYDAGAHAYAMTAVRSPEFEKLLKLLQTVDWGSLPVSNPDGDRA